MVLLKMVQVVVIYILTCHKERGRSVLEYIGHCMTVLECPPDITRQMDKSLIFLYIFLAGGNSVIAGPQSD